MLTAIAVSLLVHLLLAGYIRWPFPSPSNEPVIVHVRRITIARAVPHTPPPPTPRPVTTPHPAPAVSAVKPKVVPPPIAPRGTSGPAVARTAAPAASSAAPSATPVPTPAPTTGAQRCMDRDVTPAIAATAAPVEIPPEARAAKVNGTAAIRVQLDPQGRITSASVAQSSGNAGLDAVAMEMARGATYTPALVKCKPAAADYTFTVKFVAW